MHVLPPVLVFGGNGQLGQALLHALQPHAPVLRATTRSGQLPNGRRCEQADFNVPASLTAVLERVRPALVINAAAYTAVDAAEQDAAAALRANAEAPGVIARWCAAHGVPMVHYSTDYVFDGQATRPYREEDPTHPLGVYGSSKRDGELAVRAEGGQHLIFRVAWLYAAHGHNFLRTMLRLAAERDVLRVVADQIGSPTPASLVADVTVQALQRASTLSGTWHLTASGQTSWHGFAEAIVAQATAAGLLARAPQVQAISSADYPTPARRPACSVLDNRRLQEALGVRLPSWQDGLAGVIATLARR